MKVNPVSFSETQFAPSSPKAASGFGDLLKDALQKVQDLENEAKDEAIKLALGENTDAHQAMIALAKADLALQLTIQIRNKAIEAYQEIMRMQV